jgi:signal transduction histidine kinase
MTECLINDMMDLVKLENGAFKLMEEYFDIRMVVFKALNIVKAQANLKKLKLVGLIEVSENMHLM